MNQSKQDNSNNNSAISVACVTKPLLPRSEVRCRDDIYHIAAETLGAQKRGSEAKGKARHCDNFYRETGSIR